MTAVWIGIAAAAMAGLALAARTLRRRTMALPGRVVDLGDETRIDPRTGAVRSVQRADLLLDESALQQLWSAVNLERLARTYWRFLTRATSGLVRVRTPNASASSFFSRRPSSCSPSRRRNTRSTAPARSCAGASSGACSSRVAGAAATATSDRGHAPPGRGGRPGARPRGGRGGELLSLDRLAAQPRSSTARRRRAST